MRSRRESPTRRALWMNMWVGHRTPPWLVRHLVCWDLCPPLHSSAFCPYRPMYYWRCFIHVQYILYQIHCRQSNRSTSHKCSQVLRCVKLRHFRQYAFDFFFFCIPTFIQKRVKLKPEWRRVLASGWGFCSWKQVKESEVLVAALFDLLRTICLGPLRVSWCNRQSSQRRCCSSRHWHLKNRWYFVEIYIFWYYRNV